MAQIHHENSEIGDPINQDRVLVVADSFWDFGDHRAFRAQVEFHRRPPRFWDHHASWTGAVIAKVSVICDDCRCWATASDTRSLNSDMDPVYPEKRLSRLLRLALNNFKDRFSDSCAESLAYFIMRS